MTVASNSTILTTMQGTGHHAPPKFALVSYIESIDSSKCRYACIHDIMNIMGLSIIHFFKCSVILWIHLHFRGLSHISGGFYTWFRGLRKLSIQVYKAIFLPLNIWTYTHLQKLVPHKLKWMHTYFSNDGHVGRLVVTSFILDTHKIVQPKIVWI